MRVSGERRVARAERLVLQTWLPCLLIAAWEGAARTRLIDPLFFPPPSVVLQTAFRLAASGELLSHLAMTLTRVGVTFVAAAVTGIACGTLMGISRRINASLEPLISALYTTPKITLLPMLFLIFGIGDTARYLVVAAGSFIIVAMHTLDAVHGINRSFVEMAVNYGASRLQLVRRVYLPSALPQIFTGFRIAFGRTLVMVITVEIISSRDGLGSMIWIAGQTLATEKLYVGVVVAAVLGGLSHALLRKLEAIVVPWRTPRSAG